MKLKRSRPIELPYFDERSKFTVRLETARPGRELYLNVIHALLA